MAETNKSGLGPNALGTGLGEAIESAAKVLGNVALQGVDAGANAKTGLSWLDEWIEPFRQQLGGLSFLLPRFFQRANPAEETEHSYKLLFRAADMPVPIALPPRKPAIMDAVAYDLLVALDGIDKVLEVLKPGECASAEITETTRALIGHAVQTPIRQAAKTPPTNSDYIRAANLTDQLHRLLKVNDKRRRLPELLDELKHAVRADKQAGFARVQRDLDWIFKGVPGAPISVPELWAWYEELIQVLGETCFAEMLRYDESMNVLATRIRLGTAWQLPVELRNAFLKLGFVLSDLITVFRDSLRNGRKRYVLFDHRNDWVFYLWDGMELPSLKPQGGGPPTDQYVYRQYELEIYGPELGRTYKIRREDCECEIKLPMRVFDARVGMAVWNVNHNIVQDHLDSLQTAREVKLRAWDIGASQTPVALFVAHYRDGDLGEYYEMGIGCFVYPRRDPAAVGMFVIGDQLAVSTPLAARAGEIWGYPKKLISAHDWIFRLDDQKTRWLMRPASANYPELVIDFSLPRDGHRASPRVPLLSYTEKFGRWHRAVLMREGTGESLRLGGNRVELKVWGFDPNRNYMKDAGIVHYLREFGIIDEFGNCPRRANYSLWTEHMKGELGAPAMLRVNAQEEEERRGEE